MCQGKADQLVCPPQPSTRGPPNPNPSSEPQFHPTQHTGGGGGISPLTPLWDQPRADQVWEEGEATPIPPLPPPPCPGGPLHPIWVLGGESKCKRVERGEGVCAC